MTAFDLMPCRLCGNPVSPLAKDCATCAAPAPTPPKGVRVITRASLVFSGFVALSIVAVTLGMLLLP